MASGRNSLDHYTSQVVSKNLVRRHLKESQRAMVTAKIANMKSIDNLKRGPEVPIGTSGDAVSLKDAADMMNVGLRSANRACVVLAHGSAALQQAVEVGDIGAKR
jgi:hypothetical protein